MFIGMCTGCVLDAYWDVYLMLIGCLLGGVLNAHWMLVGMCTGCLLDVYWDVY